MIGSITGPISTLIFYVRLMESADWYTREQLLLAAEKDDRLTPRAYERLCAIRRMQDARDEARGAA